MRVDKGGILYHVLNRRVGRMELFADEGDYQAFEKSSRRPPAARACDCWPTASCPTTFICCSDRATGSSRTSGERDGQE